jgi:outer membrane protein TolC
MKTLIIILTLLIPAAGFSQGIPEQYLITAANNNPEIKAKFNEYMAALEVVPQVKSLPDMKFAFGYFIQPVETRVGPQKAKISVDQMFPWFGQLKANADVAVEQAKAKYEAFEETKSRLFFEVKTAYYDLYFSQKAVAITLENINILNTFSEISLINIEAGIGSSVDQLRIDMDISDMENQLAILKDQVLYQTVLFNNLLNVDAGEVVIFSDTLPDTDMEFDRQAVYDSILQNNHQLAQLDYELSAFMNKEVAVRKLGAPTINIGFDYIFVGKSDNPNLEAGLSGKNAVVFPRIGLTIPLYRKKYKSMVREAVYMQQAVTDRKVARTNTLETLLEKTFKEYRDADRRLFLYQRQTSLARQAMEILQTDYSTGKTDFVEVLRMENRLLKYALELEKARTDKNASKAFVIYLMGR